MVISRVEGFDDFIDRLITTDPIFSETIKASFIKKYFKKHDRILQEGDVCNEFFFIVKGGIRIYFLTPQGQEKTRHISLENQIITSLSSFISQIPSAEILEAMEDTELLSMDRVNFFDLVQKCRPWELFYRYFVETAYVVQTKRIEARITMSARQRFQLTLNENPEYFQRLSNKVLASYIDVTQETLSRLKSHNQF